MSKYDEFKAGWKDGEKRPVALRYFTPACWAVALAFIALKVYFIFSNT
jgi:hypothetical protein